MPLKRGRKRIFSALALLFVLAFLTLAFCGTFIAFAKDNLSENEVREELSDAVSSAIDKLDADDIQKFIDSLSKKERDSIGIEDVKLALKALASGQTDDFFSRILNILAKSAGEYFAGFLPSFVTIIIICLLKNILGGLTSGFQGGAGDIVHAVCYCAVIVVLMTGIGEIVDTVNKTVNSLAKLSEVLFPILLTFLSMLGGNATVAMYSPLMAVLSGVIMRIITAVILPAFIATIVFTVVGNISKTVKLTSLTKVVKSASSWLIGIVFGLYATFLTAQGVTGGVVDKFGFNVAKFAVSSYVPILGGYLSDGFDILGASLVLVKNALGYVGAITLICVVIFPLLKVVIFSLAMRLTAAIAEPAGDKRMTKLLGSTADSMGLLITAIAGVAFLFYVLVLLLIGSCNMGI